MTNSKLLIVNASKQSRSTAGMTPVTPRLVCAGAAEARILQASLCGQEMSRHDGPDSNIMQRVRPNWEVIVMLAEEAPNWRSFGPNR